MPDVTADEALTFEVTVTDADGKSSTAQTQVLVHPVPVALVFTSVPSTVEDYVTWPAVTVALQNASGDTMVGGGYGHETITLTMSNHETAGGVLSGTVIETSALGVATFADLMYSAADADVELQADAKDLGFSAASDPITVTENNVPPSVAVSTESANFPALTAAINLTATASDSSPGSIVSQSWIQTVGPDVTLTGADTLVPPSTPPT